MQNKWIYYGNFFIERFDLQFWWEITKQILVNSLIQCKRCIDDVFVFIRYLIMLSLREVLRIS